MNVSETQVTDTTRLIDKERKPMNKITLISQVAVLAGLSLLAAAAGTPALAQVDGNTTTINFDTLSHPVTGVGPANRVYQEFGPGSFTLLRIPDTSGNNPATYGDHFHTVAGNSDPSNPPVSYQTAAAFFSDDGEPFFDFDGNYTGTSSANYTPDFTTAQPFSLTSFDVVGLMGTYQFTAGPALADAEGLYNTFGMPATGATLTIDHTGIYDLANTPALAGFQNILGYRQDYPAALNTGDGYLYLDDITIQTAPAAVPEASSAVGFGLGLTLLGALALIVRRRRQGALA
jgi:hypothetical protein